MYVENMLMLESGEIGEIVGGTMIPALVDKLIELDVSLLSLVKFSVKEKLGHSTNKLILFVLVVGGNWMGWQDTGGCQVHICNGDTRIC